MALTAKIILSKSKLIDSQVFIPKVNEFYFVVTKFTLSDNWTIIEEDLFQRKNASRVGQTVHYPLATADIPITIKNL